MAEQPHSFLLHQVQGQIGKKIVIKHYGKKVVVTAYPDMSGVTPSALQQTKRERFAAAVAYARALLQDPVARAALASRVPRGKRLYNAAIKEYLAGDIGQ